MKKKKKCSPLLVTRDIPTKTTNEVHHFIPSRMARIKRWTITSVDKKCRKVGALNHDFWKTVWPLFKKLNKVTI